MSRSAERWVVVCAALSLVVASTGCSSSEPRLDEAVTTLRPVGESAGPLGYVEHLPRGYGDGSARPLLVFLHGSGEAGDGSADSLDQVMDVGLAALIRAGDWPEESPFVVLMPQYPEAEANGECALSDELHDFLDFALESYAVAPEQVYVTGISCGAIGVYDYLSQHGGDVVAAAVAIAGHGEWVSGEACRIASVPTWIFHGEMDEVVPIDIGRAIADRLGECDPPPVEVELTVYPDADHDSWSRTYDGSAGHRVFDWMLEHTRATS